MGSEKEHAGQIKDGQTAVGKPNTDEHIDTWNEPKSEPEIAASSDSEPAPEPEAEPSTEDDQLEQATSEASQALLQQNVDNSNSNVSSVLNQSTAETELFEDTEKKGDNNNLRPHRNLKNFKISVEMSEENKVVFKIPKEQVDITEEIREVFKPLPGDEEVFLEINEEKTEADVNSLTVQSLRELEALVVQQVKNIVKRQNGTQ